MTTASSSQNFHWSNSRIAFDFNPARGTYTLANLRDGSVCVEEATFQINDLSSSSGFDFTWNEEPSTDELGAGTKVTIEGKKAGHPTLLLAVIFYHEKGCLALQMGVENTAADSMRIMQYFPLKGVAYRGLAFDDYRVLDGENGDVNTFVSTAEALTSLNNLLVTFGKKGARKHSLVIGGLSYREFQKHASVQRREDLLEIELRGSDPVGKLIDPGARYWLQDHFYLDFTTDNRFEALENYGRALALANHVSIGGTTFPVLNFWYCYIDKFGADEFRNNSAGTVEKLLEVEKTGFFKYSPVAVRLEPDDYALPNNQQGWWDDAHWQNYQGGQLVEPYETIVKWGAKIREMGGIPFIYCQTAKRSEDYCLQFPGHCLFNDPLAKRSQGPTGWWGEQGDETAIYWTYDFTDPDFIAHMQEVYRNLKAGGVLGIKFDYPDTGWSYDGGFEDPYATATSAYRNIFKLAYEGLGENRDVQERIPLFGDIVLGYATTQRTEGDNDRVYPGRLTKTGLRWYKNRVVTNYDHDPINPHHVYPPESRDGWRTAITMTFTTSGRMEIGKYFEKMTAEMRHDLSRAMPLLDAPAASARPIDAFSGRRYPSVYDFTINPAWHIVTFYNCAIEGEEWPLHWMDYWTLDEQFIPKKMLPADVRVSLGDATDDGGLGLKSAAQYHAFDFWNWRYLGQLSGSETLEQTLRPGESRVMALHEVTDEPQLVSSNRHLLQGYLDQKGLPKWDAQTGELSGVAQVVADETYIAVLAANGHLPISCAAEGATSELIAMDEVAGIYELKLTSANSLDCAWRVRFQLPEKSA